MTKMVLSLLVLLGVLCGCSKKEPAATEGSPDGSVEASMLDPDEILISVNASSLTRGEAMRQVQMRLGGPPPPEMPADRVQMIQRQVLSKVIDEFVKRELLLAEADRLEIEAPEDEIETTLAGIRKRTPEGNDPKGILTDGPAGRDSLRNEVITAIRVEKLLATILPPVDEPTAAAIDAFREEHRDKLMMPERVQASHILIKVEPNASPDQKATAREQAEAIRKQLVDGADFATVAKETSACPSAQRGGELGVFPRGKMSPPFEAAAFSQTEGDIGEVIETPFGFHIIRVEKHLQPGLADDEQIVVLLKQRGRAQSLADYVRDLQRKADIKHSASVRPPDLSEQPSQDGE